MQLPKLARSTTLRWTLLVAALFAGFVVALLGFVYLKTKHDLTIRSDRMIASQMSVFADLSPERRLDAIDEHLKQDPLRVRLAALFDPNGRRISGNLENLPPDLKKLALTDEQVASFGKIQRNFDYMAMFAYRDQIRDRWNKEVLGS